MAQIKETAITIDHDTKRVRVDTTQKRVKTRLIKSGFKDISKSANLGPYWSFEGTESQILIRRGVKRVAKSNLKAKKRGSAREK